MKTINLISGNAVEKPTCLDFSGVIGQMEVRNKLDLYLTHDEEINVPTLLFTGSHGLGKTLIASKVALSLQRRFVEVNCGSIETVDEFFSKILIERVLGETPVSILMDEAHRLSKDITTVLLTLLDTGTKNIRTILSGDSAINYDKSKINMVFATTDAFKMFKPLLDRCKRVYFNAYSNAELLKMLALYCPNVKITCNTEDLSDACRGRGRDAYMLADDIKRYFKNTRYFTRQAAMVLTENHWRELKNILGIFPKGLNRQEVDLLGIIENEQPISCANIAFKMMVNEENIESEIEVRPRELGMIRSTTKGRILTEDGKKYLAKVRR